eukprot:11309197-Alexandrium_andersonii.AAC.1
MSCCMITSVVQELLYHGEQYGTPVYVGVADVKTAFNVASHDLLQRAMVHAQLPPPLIYGILQELYGLRAQAALADIGSSKWFDYAKGGPQG